MQTMRSRGSKHNGHARAWAVCVVLAVVMAVPASLLAASEAVTQPVPPSMEAFSKVFRDVAKHAQPAVVQVIARSMPKAEESGEDVPPNLKDLPDALREFFEKHRQDKGEEESAPDLRDDLDEFLEKHRRDRGEGESAPRFGVPSPRPRAGIGSGVIIDAEKGYIITNNHVVEMADTENSRIDIRLFDGRIVPGKILGRDPKTDLAMLKINTEGLELKGLPLGFSEKMEVGDWVLAIGAPFNLPQTVTQGIISAKGRNPGIVLGYEDMIQTDAAINPGNSGGPLLNLKGEIIGINTAIATSGIVAGYMGIGFAVPSETVRELLPAFEEGKEIVRGYLGVSIRSLKDFEPGIGKTYGLDKDEGILIEDMMPGSPAAKAGLKMDDIILAYDGKAVTTVHDLQRWVAGTEVGRTVDVKVWRDGQGGQKGEEIVIPVTINKQPEDFFAGTGWEDGPGGRQGIEKKEPAEVEIEALGMTVGQLTKDLAKKYGWDRRKDTDGRVVVVDVKPLGEAAAVLGIHAGDLILHVGGEAVETVSGLRAALSDEALAEGVRMRIRDAHTGRSRTLYVHVTP